MLEVQQQPISRGMPQLNLHHWGWSIIRALLLIGICYIILYPLFVKISASFMSRGDLWDQSVMWIPRNPTLLNYQLVFRHMDYPAAFLNSFQTTLSVAILQLASCTLVGYGLGRFRYRGSGLVFAGVILTLIVPPQVIMVPLYMNFRFFDFFGLLPGRGVNLIGSSWPFLLTAATAMGLRNGLFIYIMRQFFRGMPRDLEEAAYIDGAGYARTFFRVMLPGSVPAMVIVFLFAFVWQWNDYFFTTLYMSDQNILPLALEQVVLRVLGPYAEGSTPAETSVLRNTGSLLFIAPLLFLYAVLQRYFIESVERTGFVG